MMDMRQEANAEEAVLLFWRGLFFSYTAIFSFYCFWSFPTPVTHNHQPTPLRLAVCLKYYLAYLYSLYL